MAQGNLLEILSSRVLDVDVDASEEEVDAAHREKVLKWHPDRSDDPQAEQKFKAANTAQDILNNNFDFGDPDKVNTAENVLERIFSPTELDDAREISSGPSSVSSEAATRAGPGAYTAEDFMGMGKGERDEVAQEVVLGIETTIIFGAIRDLYVRDYDEEDFLQDVNEYIENTSLENFGPQEYYEASKEGLRTGVSRELFLDTITEVDERIAAQYGSDATLRQVAEIVAHFILQGGIDLGYAEFFVGDDRFGKDSRFGRGGGPFDRGPSRYGSDPRFDR